MQSVILKSMIFFVALLMGIFSQAQPGPEAIKKENKPYRILTSGKQVTIKSSKNIQNIMVWTASGHRVVEQKAINASSYSFTIDVSGKIFFLMLELNNNERYTEKIGVN